MNITDYFRPSLIKFLDSPSRNEAIEMLIELAELEKKFSNRDLFRKAVFEREELISTGIGMGVAVPHAKLKEFNDFFVIVGIQQKRGIEWNAIDKAPVHFIFLIGGPDDRQTDYLQILSQLTMLIKDQEVRKQLMNASTAQEVIDIFSHV